jgi:hypothetical protein
MSNFHRKLVRPTIEEAFTRFLTISTEEGDTVKLAVKFNGADKPEVSITAFGISETIRSIKNPSRIPTLNLTEYLDTAFVWTTSNGVASGYKDWREYIEKGIGPAVKDISVKGNRAFSYEVLS